MIPTFFVGFLYSPIIALELSNELPATLIRKNLLGTLDQYLVGSSSKKEHAELLTAKQTTENIVFRLTEEKEVEDLLKSLTFQLKKMISATEFKADEFFARAYMFRQALLYITSWLNKFKPSNALLKQVKFSQKIFLDLEEATEFLMPFLPPADLLEYILRRNILLNVKTLDFYNSYGEADFLRIYFARDVQRFLHLLKLQADIFQELKHVQPDVHGMFWSFYTQANDHLKNLAKIPFNYKPNSK